MNAKETITHFQDMGVLEHVIESSEDRPMIIMASASKEQAHECMKEFTCQEDYYRGMFGIDATTDDGVAIRMMFKD